MNNILIKEIKTKSIITKSNLPVCDYSVNPYVSAVRTPANIVMRLL